MTSGRAVVVVVVVDHSSSGDDRYVKQAIIAKQMDLRNCHQHIKIDQTSLNISPA